MKRSFIILLVIVFCLSMPAAAAGIAFTDVAPGAYYYDPVVWAVDENITTGTTATTFSPDATCTRGQIVTFLYRALHDSHSHSYTAKVTAPTCTEKGYTTYTCACGDKYVDDEVAALGHSHTAVVTAPDCTENGYTT